MDVARRARAGGLARARTLDAEDRARIARKAHLAGAVRTVARRVDALTPEQLDVLREALRGVS